MIDLHLCDVLAILAETRRHLGRENSAYFTTGWHQACDESARRAIAAAVPPGLRIPSPGDPKRQRMASGSPELAPQPQANAREAYLLQYRTLCEGQNAPD